METCLPYYYFARIGPWKSARSSCGKRRLRYAYPEGLFLGGQRMPLLLLSSLRAAYAATPVVYSALATLLFRFNLF